MIKSLLYYGPTALFGVVVLVCVIIGSLLCLIIKNKFITTAKEKAALASFVKDLEPFENKTDDFLNTLSAADEKAQGILFRKRTKKRRRKNRKSK